MPQDHYKELSCKEAKLLLDSDYLYFLFDEEMSNIPYKVVDLEIKGTSCWENDEATVVFKVDPETINPVEFMDVIANMRADEIHYIVDPKGTFIRLWWD